jgi:hypothetical protein
MPSRRVPSCRSAARSSPGRPVGHGDSQPRGSGKQTPTPRRGTPSQRDDREMSECQPPARTQLALRLRPVRLRAQRLALRQHSRELRLVCARAPAEQVRVIEAPCSPLASNRQQCWCPRRLIQVMVMRSAGHHGHHGRAPRPECRTSVWPGEASVVNLRHTRPPHTHGRTRRPASPWALTRSSLCSAAASSAPTTAAAASARCVAAAIDAPCTPCLRHGDPIRAKKRLTAAARRATGGVLEGRAVCVCSGQLRLHHRALLSQLLPLLALRQRRARRACLVRGTSQVVSTLSSWAEWGVLDRVAQRKGCY